MTVIETLCARTRSSRRPCLHTQPNNHVKSEVRSATIARYTRGVDGGWATYLEDTPVRRVSTRGEIVACADRGHDALGCPVLQMQTRKKCEGFNTEAGGRGRVSGGECRCTHSTRKRTPRTRGRGNRLPHRDRVQYSARPSSESFLGTISSVCTVDTILSFSFIAKLCRRYPA